MGKWGARSGLYKAALILTYFVFLVYGLAFAVPAWLGRDPAVTDPNKIQFLGLWLSCEGSDEIDFDDCSENSFGDDWDWMDAVRGCWTGGMFFFLVGVIYSLIENCCGDENSKDYGLTGTLVLLSGLCGAAGVIVATVNMEDSDSHGLNEYYWGFMIACIASGLAILLAIVLIIARNSGFADSDSVSDEDENKRRHGSRAIDYVNNYKQPPYGHGYGSPYEYHNAGYRGDQYQHGPQHDGYAPPLGNGVNYHHQPTAAHPYTMYQGSSLPRQNGGGYRHSMAESADLSNGFTPTIMHAEQSMGRPGRGDYYGNGNRPY
ncbi:hypothetical protein PoB_005786500 [Plakobranchus ocellatus]|uniref:Uncharacterized protein n=1 Tax=Plakobranchus ocellatus TaxID=259542 RepID=A0AAV4CEW6_9GAST|nr:hypothetical protein PoB_005786500 [Plakobranchus ocellatus]